MGKTADCNVEIDGKVAKVEALLETDEIILRSTEGKGRTLVPRASIKEVRAEDGVLFVRHAKGELRITLGAAAEKWAKELLQPKGRIEKLGVAAGQSIAVV